MLHTLVYVSRKTIDIEREPDEIEKILNVARVWNDAHGITGALINARNAFMQLLEGSSDAIDELMSRIMVDRRHEDVRIIRKQQTSHRLLPHWSMAYSGPWTYVANQVEPLVDRGTEAHPEMVDRLTELIVAFAQAQTDQPTDVGGH
jgi:hypothetical protein